MRQFTIFTNNCSLLQCALMISIAFGPMVSDLTNPVLGGLINGLFRERCTKTQCIYEDVSQLYKNKLANISPSNLLMYVGVKVREFAKYQNKITTTNHMCT